MATPDAMLADREYIEQRSDAMDLRRIIPTDITASAIAHLSLLTLLLLFSDVHPFGAVTAERASRFISISISVVACGSMPAVGRRSAAALPGRMMPVGSAW